MLLHDFIKPPASIFEARIVLKDLGLQPIASMKNINLGVEHVASEDLTIKSRGLQILWACACIGSKTAATQYAISARTILHETTLPSDYMPSLLAIADTWGEIGEEAFDFSSLQLLPATDDPTPDTEQEGSTEMSNSPEVTQSNGMIVLERVGDPHSQEGKALSMRLRPILGKPLPTRSLVPAENAVRDSVLAMFPWANNAAEAVETAVTLIRMSNSSRPLTKPFLFVGPSGTGKTTLAMYLANLLGRHSVKVPVGGTADSATLSAISRGWANYRPSLAVQAMLESVSSDPCIVLDELDKGVQVGNQNGSVAGTLLSMMDSRDAYYDTALMSNVDLSNILFLATANDPDRIPTALLDRFTPIVIPRPTDEHFHIILRNLKFYQATDLGVPVIDLPDLDKDEAGALRSFFNEQKPSLRTLRSAYQVALVAALKRARMPTMLH